MRTILFCFLCLFIFSCKEKYISPFVNNVDGYLVVEGNINNGKDSTVIKLSRSTRLDNDAVIMESGAIVKLEGDDKMSYNLNEIRPGFYQIAQLGLNEAKKYRLSIVTKSGKKYFSEFVPVKDNPAIDSVQWKVEQNGVQLYINTHDDLNKTKYYHWEFDETWEFHSTYKSFLQINESLIQGKKVYTLDYRNLGYYSFDSSIYYCWRTEPSKNILIGTSINLSNDVISLPIHFIPNDSWKLGVRYSINVKQYSLSKSAYDYLLKMKKNTESTGSIFDAQPSELKGNFYSESDKSETVIGFLNISNIKTKRIFIDNTQLSNWRYKESCFLTEIKNDSDSIRINGIGFIPTDAAKTSITSIISYYAGTPKCVDCTFRGTNIKPAFWIK